MPLIVDKDAVRGQILSALEACIVDKPLDRISLRDIAAQAGMTHPKLLHYFPSKDALVLAYCEYAKCYMSEHCRQWFAAHKASDFDSPLSCINAFMCYVAEGGSEEMRPNATVQTYVLARYNGDIREMVSKEFAEWRAVMYACLREVYGDAVTPDQAEVMMILITGTFICNYTGALTGKINQNILSAVQPLLDGH